MDPEFSVALSRGVALFNRQEFFEAHDAWEDYWLNTHGDDRLLLQGLIQTAAAFYKLQLGNLRGMVLLLEDAKEALGRTQADHGIDLVKARGDVHRWLGLAREWLPAGSAIDPLPELPVLRLLGVRSLRDDPSAAQS